MTTPMRSQYLALKKQYPDIILLFRLGDFYETFDDDAKIVSSVCDVVLTSRPVGNDERVPLAGVPYHAVDNYIAKLISAGYRVAIAEQIGNEPPKGEKIVPRVVRRVVTAGHAGRAGLAAREAEQLRRRARAGAQRGAAWRTPTSARASSRPASWRTAATCCSQVAEELSRLGPAEVLHPAKDPRWATAGWRGPVGGPRRRDPPGARAYHVTPYAAWRFEESTARAALLEHFRAASLEGFGCEGKPLGCPRRGRAAAVSAGDAEGGPAPDHRAAHVQPRRVHDAGRGDAAQPGADRDHPRRLGSGLAAWRAGRHPDAHGWAAAAPLARPAAAQRGCAGAAPGRRRGVARRRGPPRRTARAAARPGRPGAWTNRCVPGHRAAA